MLHVNVAMSVLHLVAKVLIHLIHVLDNYLELIVVVRVGLNGKLVGSGDSESSAFSVDIIVIVCVDHIIGIFTTQLIVGATVITTGVWIGLIVA